MNKFEMMNKVLVSTLRPEDKALLVELILRADEEGKSFPSVERLCQVRGIKHEKNFKGVDVYLPGLVTKGKRGRKNYYLLREEAIMALPANAVNIRHTPAVEGVSHIETSDTPAVEGVYTPAAPDNTPAAPDNTPAVEGANSTRDSSRDNSKESTSDASSFSRGTFSVALSTEPSPSLNKVEGRRSALFETNKEGRDLTSALKATLEEDQAARFFYKSSNFKPELVPGKARAYAAIKQANKTRTVKNGTR